MKNKGFTYIEVVLATSILTTVIIVVNIFWYFIRNNYQFVSTNYRLTQNADHAVRVISTELRQAEEAMNGSYALNILEDDQLAYFADIDSDGKIERVRYYVQNRSLMRGLIEPTGNPPQYNGPENTSVITENLSAAYTPLFRYYNDNWPIDTVVNPLLPAARMLETRLVEINIPLEIQNGNSTTEYTARSMVLIRNLKSNL